MTAHSGIGGPAAGLTGRLSERGVLDRFVAGVRAGAGQALVVRGEPGVGKTVLLDYLAGEATSSGCRVVRAIGVQSEMELAFAGLHQLCAPMLGHAESLPVPQREALRTAFGLSAGPVPDRFLVGLAVVGLLSEAAGERPLVCVVDDQQWLDHASAQALGFAARRLAADPVGLVFAARVPGKDVAGLPELVVEGLAEGDARELLESVLTGPLDARVRDRIIADTHGNPLALLELPRGLTPAQLTGGFGLGSAVPLDGRIEESFGRQLEMLPAQTRRLLQLAAADPSGEPVLVWRAGGRLPIGAGAAGPAAEAGLAEFGARVRFRHPLVRSAAYRVASARDRQEVHRVLAEATDPEADPDRRAWHRARAAAGPDEDVAAELERSAGRAQARGGLAAAAAFLERAAELTAEPARRAERTLAAAQADMRAGAFSRALELLATAEAGPVDDVQGARADLLRGQIAFASGPGSDAPLLLLKAARRLEPLDQDLARETYLDAWQAALCAGPLAVGGDLEEVPRAARAMPAPPRPPQPADLLLDGLALLVTDGPAAAAPALRQAISGFADADIPAEKVFRWGRAARIIYQALWDSEGRRLTTGHVQLARDAGALDQLPFLLVVLAVADVARGDFAAAASLIAETDAVCETTGSHIAPYAAMVLAASVGRQAEAAPLIRAVLEQAQAQGEGAAVTWAHWVAALLYNGLGRYSDALAAARQASGHRLGHIAMWAPPELGEAPARTGNTGLAGEALDQLSGWTQAGRTDWGLGVEARRRVLLSVGEAADRLYREAITRLGRTGMRPDLARARLLYGEWLRRQRHRTDAREQLRAACELLEAIGMEAFAARARRELRAAGATARGRAVSARAELTAQEAQIARLAADGLSNPEIGTRLFLSPRTVQYHLGKVFTKLGITARAQLSRALTGD